MDNFVNEVENDMIMFGKKVVTSSPAKLVIHSPNSSEVNIESDIISPVKSDRNEDLSLKVDANESLEIKRNTLPNGLLTYSTPQNYSCTYNYNSAELCALNFYRSLLQFNSTPKNNQKIIQRKPRINFHSIDDIVNGGKTNDNDNEHSDSGYQSQASMNLTNNKDNIEKDQIKIKPSDDIEYINHNNDKENEYDADNVENNKIQISNVNNKKIRTTFSDQQKFMLDQYFRRNPYPDPRETEDLSRQLNLPENVIKVWFQNKRSRDKQRRFSNNAPAKSLSVELTNQLNNLQLLNVLASNQFVSNFY